MGPSYALRSYGGQALLFALSKLLQQALLFALSKLLQQALLFALSKLLQQAPSTFDTKLRRASHILVTPKNAFSDKHDSTIIWLF